MQTLLCTELCRCKYQCAGIDMNPSIVMYLQRHSCPVLPAALSQQVRCTLHVPCSFQRAAPAACAQVCAHF